MFESRTVARLGAARPAAMRVLGWGLVALAVSAGCDSPPPPPKLGTIDSFSLQDQNGQPFTEKQLRGKVWVGAFMFTRCPTVCPRITKQMHELQLVTNTRGLPLHLVSFTVDPEHDTPPVLYRYGKQHGADFDTWTFATGDYEQIKHTAVESFKQALEGEATEGADHLGILHGSHLALVDQDLTLRGFYRTSEPAETGELLRDAAKLHP